MSQAKRRTNGSSRPNAQAEPTSTTSANKSQSSNSTSRFLLLAIYPTILITGSLFSLLEPHARAAPYSVLTQSHPPELAPSYFARKSNILNQYFVKILWIWITSAFGLFLLLHPLTGSPFKFSGPGTGTRPATGAGFALSRRRVQAFFRYFLVTTLWVFTTQWFFGAPLIDRGFRFSGGKCELAGSRELHDDEPAKEFLTAVACKVAGGKWSGGHDISGHVFILILGSAFLVLEALPVLDVIANRGWAVLEERRQQEEEEEKNAADGGGLILGSEGDEREWGISMAFIAGVVGTSFWMLLMTATYFHTWFEKLTGLVVAFLGITLVYILPHFVPALDSILGRPGV